MVWFIKGSRGKWLCRLVLSFFALPGGYPLSAQLFVSDRRPSTLVNDTIRIGQELIQAEKISLLYPDSAIVICKELYGRSKRAGHQNGGISALFQLGNIALRNSLNSKAIVYFQAAIRQCDTVQDRTMLADLYTNMGNAYNNQSRFDLAYKTYAAGAGFARSDSVRLTLLYGNSATVLGQLKQYDKALFYINLALNYACKYDNYKIRSMLLMNKGRCYYELKDFKSSAYFTDSAVVLSRFHGMNIQLRATLVESARVDIALGKAQEALPKLLEAIALSRLPGMSVNTKNDAISTTGDAYLRLKNYNEAEKYLLWAWSNVYLQPYERLFVEERLAVLYAATGKFEKAFSLQKDYRILKDSLQSNEVTLSVNELETRYRTSEKDKEIATKRLMISNQEKRMAEKSSLLYGIIFFALLATMLMLWRFFYLKQKNRKLESLQEIRYLKAVMEGEQKERVRIATELHDGIVSELTLVKMNMEATGFSSAHPGCDQDSLRQLAGAIRNVRNTAHNLMPEIVLRYNLSRAVELLCVTIQKTGRLDILFQQYGDFTQLPMSLRQSVYFMIQELLHNIIKHAHASRALVQLSCYDRLLTITIEDNGIGMEFYKGKGRQGMGLISLMERINKENGRIEWKHTDSGEGTNVHMEFDVVPFC